METDRILELVELLVPVATFALGIFGASLADERKERNARKREEERSRQDFVRSTLFDLQDALYTLGLQSYFLAQVRWEGATHGLDDEAARLQAFARAGVLRVRVPDASVRDLAQKVRDLANEVRKGETAAETQAALAAQGEVFQQVNERIGQILRAEVELE